MEDWKKNLEAKAIEYLGNTVVPAFEKLKIITEKSNRKVEIVKSKKEIKLEATGKGNEMFSYTIRVGERPPQGNYPLGFVYVDAEIFRSLPGSVGDRKKHIPLIPIEHGKPYSILDISEDDIISHFKKSFRFELREVLFGD